MLGLNIFYMWSWGNGLVVEVLVTYVSRFEWDFLGFTLLS